MVERSSQSWLAFLGSTLNVAYGKPIRGGGEIVQREERHGEKTLSNQTPFVDSSIQSLFFK